MFQKHETYLQSIVDEQEKYIDRKEQKIEKMKMENLFNELINARKRSDELEDKEIKGLLKLFAVKRTKLEERKQQLNQNI
ncbi:hypothetical protein T459_15201 [Capsicum annuum]|uniref:Uncharacterized protein n=1 Tax=Capsicum annuum TaxID=4072 RepID=A0A2G2ZJP0_CAPAN|nr:hypothetical protein T459_15201 [Capsicum annuum]